jgi:hypothetical protein
MRVVPLQLSMSCLMVALAFGAVAKATTTVSTVPQGYLMVSIPAGSVTTPSVTTFSLPMNESVPSNFVGEATGQITSVTSSTITNSSGGWTPGSLSEAATPYFIRITSGTAEGQTFQISTSTSNTSTVLTVLNQTLDLTTLGIATGANGDTYEIFPGETVASLFGTTTLGSTAAATADVVRLFNGSWTEYYYNTSAGQWRTGSVPVDVSNTVIRPDSGITFYRRGGTSLQYALLGTVASTNIQIVVNNTGANYVGNVFPVDQTLLVANYNSLPGWVNNTGSVSAADVITIWDGAAYDPYNYLLSAGQWRTGSVPVNENNVVIPAGTPVIFQRPASNTGVTVLTRVLPYSLN